MRWPQGAQVTGEELVRNYVVEGGLHRTLPDRILLWDETMRDGEQTPGVYFSPDEKLEMASLMADMGVHITDAGIPVVSKDEYRAVKAIANAGLGIRVLGAARAVRADVDACLDCGVDEIAVFIACSDLHLRYKLQMSRDDVLAAAVGEVEYAKDHGVTVNFVTEDTFRADLDYVETLYNACIEAGADRAVICDTVGVMVPSGVKWFVERVRERFRDVELSVHCHNDFGLAVANSLAALEAGVQVPHTCVNGIGERSGNASFEEVVLALKYLYDRDVGVDVGRMFELSRLVEKYSGIPVAVNKPLVGYNAFSHESGIHADGVIKHTATYEPIQPEWIGRERRFIFGKHTGSMAVRDWLKRHGVDATEAQVKDIVARIKALAENRDKGEQVAWIERYREREERRRGVSDREFWDIVAEAGLPVPPGREA
jgi:isopropylmalate/homocitrate/citramalate synthase